MVRKAGYENTWTAHLKFFTNPETSQELRAVSDRKKNPFDSSLTMSI